jgi:GNAT superfamily N-acetyltransferase
VIRKATIDDVGVLAALNVRSWKVDYRGIIPDAYLDAISVEDRAARFRANLADAERDVVVWELDGQVVGFANVGASRDADAAAATGELVAIYLDREFRRRGLGRELVAWAKNVARRRGWPLMTLWVLRENAPARRFYEAEGFRPDGAARDVSFGGVAVTELRYEWAGPDRPSRA